MRTLQFQRSFVLLLVAMLLAVAMYWAGLHGPLLLDDSNNLALVPEWLAGRASLAAVLHSGEGMFGRPLSMASFALSAWLGGYTPFAFKLGNLLVHLASGAILYLLIGRMARRDDRLRAHARVIATLVSAAWLLHPLHASTVLYAVQRMAQLSALCMLLGMWWYMLVRARLEERPTWQAMAGLFLGIPLLTVAGFLAKENAVLLPALCLVLELGCFAGALRPRAVWAFFGLGLLLPFVLGTIWIALGPMRLFDAYIRRDFDWQERLLTQARALCDYLGQILVPVPSRMGVHTDDFPLSTGLLAPPTTLVAIVLLVAITIAAWWARRRIPALFVGWGIFLVGHALESSVVPLELYFEHRNYLPLAGVLYALAGLITFAVERMKPIDMRLGRIGTVLAIAVLALLASGTHRLARAWSSYDGLAEHGAAGHPDSMRAQLAVVDSAVRRGDIARANRALNVLMRSQVPRIRAQGYLNRINLDCATTHATDRAFLASALRDMPRRLSKDEAQTFDLLFQNTRAPCSGVNDLELAVAAERFALNAREQPDWLGAKAELRHAAARFHVRRGDWASALPLARLAWQPGMAPATSVLLVQAQIAAGELAGAEQTYREAAARVSPTNPQDVAGLRWLRRQIDSARNAAPRDKNSTP